jgi:hypothetical protein
LPGKLTGEEKRQVKETSLTKEATIKGAKCLAGLFAVLLFMPAGAQGRIEGRIDCVTDLREIKKFLQQPIEKEIQ